MRADARNSMNDYSDNAPVTIEMMTLADIDQLDQAQMQRFHSKMVVQSALTRPLVSFQANKTRPVYRWYKYKEAFSASLVEYFLRQYKIEQGVLLDPFAGSGVTLFAASALGLDAVGIELLPIGQQIIAAKRCIEAEFTSGDCDALQRWATTPVWEQESERVPLPELRITRGAYPEATRNAIEHYLAACRRENDRVQTLLRFALLCVLESISFTRKDGQYLRWDHRAGRRSGKEPFDKGAILGFTEAIHGKLQEILNDLAPAPQLGFFTDEKTPGAISLHAGSCLELLPQFPDSSYDAIMTSPPYCNRYDYTRTYALELALLGVDEARLRELRQEMLSCTVENRAKDLLGINSGWELPIAAADDQELLQAILAYLEAQKAAGVLNNQGIPRMVRGYFYEMACVIAECARVLKPGAPLFMVNDNVRYAGASISVDLILSALAENLGFEVENILILPNGKGNSSQQMGEHGREALRKCVYVWVRV